MTSDRTTWKVAETAAYYRVRSHTVLAWIRSGELEAENVAATTSSRPAWRISLDALERFAAKRRNRPEPKAVKKQRAATEDRIIPYFSP